MALVVAGCGGDDEQLEQLDVERRQRRSPAAARSARASRAATSPSSPPATSTTWTRARRYYTFGYMVQYAVNRPLYSFTPGRPGHGRARTSPTASRRSPTDKKTITVKIKTGVKYAPPVNREVTSKDVKYAIERAFTTNVPSGYATSYFAEIEGAPDDAGHDRRAQAVRRPADAGRPDARHQAHQAGRPARRRGARDADHRPGAGGVRGASSTRRRRPTTTSTSPSPARTWSRTTRRPASSPAVEPGKQHRARPQPELGQGDRLPARVPGLDHDRGGQRRR